MKDNFEKQDFWREKKRKNKSLDYLQSLGIEFIDKSINIENDYIAKEDLKILYSAIQKLSLNQKMLIKQIFFDGKSQAEIAREENVGESAIRSRLKKIYRKLKKYLENL